MSTYTQQTNIDDRFAATDLRPSAPEATKEGSGTSWPPPGYHNVPRTGNWTVSSNIGSAVDDRCPTEWDLGSEAAGSECRANKPISRGLVEKLGRAVIEKKAAERAIELEVKSENATARTPSGHDIQTKINSPKKGFYLPKSGPGNLVKGIKVTVKAENKTRTTKERPASAPLVTKTKDSPKKISAIQSPSVKNIRIVDKNGDEAVIKVPILPAPGSRSNSRISSGASYNKKKDTEKHEEHNQTAVAPELRERLKKIAATENSEHNSKQRVSKGSWSPARGFEKIPEDQASNISDGLLSIKSLRSAVNSINGNERRFKEDDHRSNSSGNSRRTSVAGSEKAASITTKATSVASSRRSSAVSAQSLQASVRSISENSNRSKKSSENDFRVVGERIRYEVPRLQIPQHSSARERTSPVSPLSPGLPEFSAYPASPVSPQSNQSHRSHRSRTKPPTVFAGRGWISPHPLSVISEEVLTPQTAIRVPRGDFRETTFTYEDWNAVRNGDTERSFCHSESQTSEHRRRSDGSVKSVSRHSSQRSHSTGSRKAHSFHEDRNGSDHSASSGSKRTQRAWKALSEKESHKEVRGWAMETQYDGTNNREQDSSAEEHAKKDSNIPLQIVNSPNGRQQVHLPMPWDNQN